MQFISMSQAGIEVSGAPATPATLTDSTNIASTPRGAETNPTKESAAAAQQKLSTLMSGQQQPPIFIKVSRHPNAIAAKSARTSTAAILKPPQNEASHGQFKVGSAAAIVSGSFKQHRSRNTLIPCLNSASSQNSNVSAASRPLMLSRTILNALTG